jgi:Rieske Fe-S protein
MQSRKEFLQTAAAVGTATFAVGLVSPSEANASDEVIAVLGKVKDLNEKGPVFVKASFKDAKGTVVEEDKLYVRWDKASNQWIILHAICTHLKCKIDVAADGKGFVCPCHGSSFDANGKVLKKPAKKDLPNFANKAFEEDGELKLKRDAPKK